MVWRVLNVKMRHSNLHSIQFRHCYRFRNTVDPSPPNFDYDGSKLNDIDENLRDDVENLGFIGFCKRKIVGPGTKGYPDYLDHVNFPYPAIHYKECSPIEDKIITKAKELGWNSLSKEEVKTCTYDLNIYKKLNEGYRLCFRQTFAEMSSSKCFYHKTLVYFLIYSALALWVINAYYGICLPPLDNSVSEEDNIKRIERQLRYHIHEHGGLTAQWDYENRKWKD
ncbi:MAG: Cytochrome c oxidase subunit IV [Paramarteilia canceri]